jgi:hypothetical protein
MTRTTPEIRIQTFDNVLAYLKANLLEGQPDLFIDRIALANSLGAEKWLGWLTGRYSCSPRKVPYR